jgi:hypothetical protein
MCMLKPDPGNTMADLKLTHTPKSNNQSTMPRIQIISKSYATVQEIPTCVHMSWRYPVSSSKKGYIQVYCKPTASFTIYLQMYKL